LLKFENIKTISTSDFLIVQMKHLSILVVIGMFSQTFLLILVPIGIHGQNSTFNSELANGSSGIIIIDTIDSTKEYPYFNNVCLYESQVYSQGAVVNMNGTLKACFDNMWQ